MRLFTLSTLLALSRYVAAQGVIAKLASPTAGVATTVTFTDAGGSPNLAQLVNSQAQLWVGGWDASTATVVQDLGVLQYAAGSVLTVTIDKTKAGLTTNGFYIKTISAVNGGGTVINFSERFTIAGMTGVTPPQFITAAAAAAAAPPAAQVQGVNNGGGNNGGNPDAGAYGVPYTLQTGLTKYAPMQPVPPTKITKKNATPLFPTSAFVIAKTFLPIPSIVKTITNPQTFSVSSMENTAAAQAQPTGAMAKYLARWKD